MKKHVVVLEQAGLVTTEKIGRVRTCNDLPTSRFQDLLESPLEDPPDRGITLAVP